MSSVHVSSGANVVENAARALKLAKSCDRLLLAKRPQRLTERSQRCVFSFPRRCDLWEQQGNRGSRRAAAKWECALRHAIHDRCAEGSSHP
jgi:hypothetical protein